jgi:hypothetical protein
MLGAIVVWETLDGFSGHFEVTDNSILDHRVALECLFAVSNVPLDPVGALESLREIDTRVPRHNGRAPFRMRRRSNQWSASSVQ